MFVQRLIQYLILTEQILLNIKLKRKAHKDTAPKAGIPFACHKIPSWWL